MHILMQHCHSLRPLREPVDGAAVDKGGEHSAARAEGVSDWTHAEDDVQFVLDTADEVGKYTIPVEEVKCYWDF